VSERSELTIITAINDHWRHHPVERLDDVHELMVPQ